MAEFRLGGFPFICIPLPGFDLRLFVTTEKAADHCFHIKNPWSRYKL